MKITLALVSITLASLAMATVIYGGLTSWWRTRTGIGFLSMMASFTFIVGVTLADLIWDAPRWLWWLAWILVIITVNLGIAWNIIYKQFIQRRPEIMGAKRHEKKDNHG